RRDRHGRDADGYDGREGFGGLRRDRARDGDARWPTRLVHALAHRHDESRRAGSADCRGARFGYRSVDGYRRHDVDHNRQGRQALLRLRVHAAMKVRLKPDTTYAASTPRCTWRPPLGGPARTYAGGIAAILSLSGPSSSS